MTARIRQRAGRASMPIGDWPVEDRRLFETAFAPGDVFDSGALSHLAPSSREATRWGYGVWLAHVAGAHPERLPLSPSERADRPTLVALARHLAARGQSRNTIDNAMKAVSRLLQVAGDGGVRERVRGLSRIGAVRREDAAAIVSSDRLIDLGVAMMDAALAAGGILAADRATFFRDGLLVAFLAAAPLRRANFAALELGVGLIVHPDRMIVSVAPEFTKSRNRIELEVPRIVDGYVRRYLADVRPLLPGAGGSTYLWPSNRGRHLTADRIYNIVIGITERAFGRALSPHDFRDAAATTIALHAPEKIAVAKDLLAHVNLKTTEKHYVRARGVETSRAVEKIVKAVRGRGN